LVALRALEGIKNNIKDGTRRADAFCKGVEILQGKFVVWLKNRKK
jgi:hypothetical protein